MSGNPIMAFPRKESILNCLLMGNRNFIDTRDKRGEQKLASDDQNRWE